MGKHQLARSVSIVGVGYSPLGYVTKTPEVLHWTERELFASASIEAMEDAGINPKDIDAYYVGTSGPGFSSKTKSAAPHYGRWIGMHGKPALFHDEGCGSFLAGMYESVMAVASGMYDCVLNGGINILNSVPRLNYPMHIRDPYPREDLYNNTWTDLDSAYEKPGTGGLDGLDLPIIAYMKKYGISLDEMDDALAAYVIGERRAAIMNPKNLTNRIPFEDEAKRFGFDDVKKYLLHPKFNPRIGSVVRGKWMSLKPDAASVCIVCATEKVKELCPDAKPILIAGIDLRTYNHVDDLRAADGIEKPSFDAAFEMAGIKDPAKEIEYMEVMNSVVHHVISLVEDSGYVPRGEAWKYMRDGRFAYDGDRPINASGGKNQLGHPSAASGGISIAEAIYQMRGEAGPRQIKKQPKVTCVWGAGGGSTQISTVLKAE